MSEIQAGPTLATNRDAVTHLIAAGEPFGHVEHAIDEVTHLTMDQKAAVWLLAFSLRDPREQQTEARAYLGSVS